MTSANRERGNINTGAFTLACGPMLLICCLLFVLYVHANAPCGNLFVLVVGQPLEETCPCVFYPV